jgi:ferrochelatase
VALGTEQRIAVILFNLGGPEGRETVRPFLFNFFRDKNIVTLPAPLRHMLAAFIAFRRSAREAGSSYKLLGWKSPLLENTKAQSDALENSLNASGQGVFKNFVCMRYWHPFADAVAREVRAWKPDRIVLLPLYPQYSTTTTRSSLQSWMSAAKKAGLTQSVSAVCCYPFNAGFVGASAERIRPVWQKTAEEAQAQGLPAPRLLFSAHGLPKKTIAGGDPYQWQCEQSAKAIAAQLGIAEWQICYQSKVGRLEWIGPSTIEALERAAAEKRPVVIYPHAFVSEHVETLVELDIEYKHMAAQTGVPLYARVETAGTDAAFIDGLRQMVLDHAAQKGLKPDGGRRICPRTCGQCALAEPALSFL